MFDLKKMNIADLSEKGYEFELKIPEIGTPTGAFLTVKGDNSKTVRNYTKKQFEVMQSKAKQARKRGKEVEEITISEAEDMAVEAAIVRLVDWKGIVEDGKEVKFNEENVRRILKEHPWIRQAIMDESEQLSNFVK